MYAVVKTGGKQYRVTAGQILEVEKLDGAIGDSVTLDDVLLVADGDDVTIGQPAVDGASVVAKITGQYRGKKILSFRYRPKKRIRVRRGHRQYLTRLQIESVSFGGKTYDEAAAEADVPKSEPQTVADEDVEASADTDAGVVESADDAVESAAAAVAETAGTAAEAVVEAGETVADAAESTVDDAVDAATDTDDTDDEENA